jgi:tetratricopeptide (TPR) repeat protein
MGLVLFYRGQGREALDHVRTSFEHYRPGDFHIVTFGVGHDQGIFARVMTAWLLWWLGRPDAALDEARSAIREAELLGSFLSLAMARHCIAVIHQLRREYDQALEQAQRNVASCSELGFPYWAGAALVTAGTERMRMGDPAGLEDIGRGLGLLGTAESRSGTTSALGALAEAQHALGETEAALGTVEAALRLSGETGEPYWDAELLRLKAVFQPPGGELLRTALADATARGSASIALRVATTLGDPVAVAAALEEIEGGEDTADVREARQLLDDMQPAKEVR